MAVTEQTRSPSVAGEQESGLGRRPGSQEPEVGVGGAGVAQVVLDGPADLDLGVQSNGPDGAVSADHIMQEEVPGTELLTMLVGYDAQRQTAGVDHADLVRVEELLD